MTNGIRLAIVDDGLFTAGEDRGVRPVAATFHRFVEATVSAGQFRRARYLIPVRALRPGEYPSVLPAVDESLLEVVPTAPFAGIADYVLRAGPLSLHNWPRILETVADSDLVWIRLPASNALLTMTACHVARVPHFGWLAGSVGDVTRGQQRSLPAALAARAVGAAYDAVSGLAGRRGPLVKLNEHLFTSVITTTELAVLGSRPHRRAGPWRIVWAGRMASEKGLPDALRAIQLLLEAGIDVQLSLIGDGPLSESLQRSAVALGAGRVRFHGYVGERARFLQLMADGDVFIHPSHAEGMPKVLVEAMAAGLPVVATAVGAVPALLADGERGRIVPQGRPEALARAVRELLGDPAARQRLMENGRAYAGQHTAEVQAARLLAWLRVQFPHLPWSD